jgi:hypothetical protein
MAPSVEHKCLDYSEILISSNSAKNVWAPTRQRFVTDRTEITFLMNQSNLSHLLQSSTGNSQSFSSNEYPSAGVHTFFGQKNTPNQQKNIL